MTTPNNGSNVLNLARKYFADHKGAQAVFYLSDGIYFAKFDGNDFGWAGEASTNWQQKIILARIFNLDKELKIWLDGSGLEYRLRDESKSNPGDIVEARQILWGTQFEELLKEGWIRLQEERGTELKIPFPEKPDNAMHDRIAVRTYNYIAYLDNGQATYCDSRFVALEKIVEPVKQE